MVATSTAASASAASTAAATKGRPRNWQRSARWYQVFFFFLGVALYCRTWYHTVVTLDNNSVLTTPLKPRLLSVQTFLAAVQIFFLGCIH